MRGRCKRSERPLMGGTIAAAALLATGCAGASAENPPAALFAGKTVIATLDESAEWSRGVHDYPLAVGERLLFAFPVEMSPRWTMLGVDYPLQLTAYSEAGYQLGALVMPPCEVGPCPLHELEGVEARWWVETRLPDG